MKKIGTLALTLILLFFSTISTSSCDNSGFTLVKSVSITTSGEKLSFNSTTTPQTLFTFDCTISQSEFIAAPENRKFYDTYNLNFKILSKITINDAIKAAKHSTHYEVVEKELEGYWYCEYPYTQGTVYNYVKYKYETTYCNFVYVKVKNDTTLVIKSGSDETTYTVSSYRIEEF